MLYVQDAINRLDLFVKELQSSMPAISKEVAGLLISSQIAKIKRDGVGNYSTNKVPAFLFKGKALTSTGTSFIDSKIKKREPIGWKDLRQAEGLPVRVVDLWYSGQMLSSLGIIRANSASTRYYTIIGGTNNEARKKMYANMLRYGRFLYPRSREVQQALGELALKRVGDIYKRILLT